jgi:threonine/homoserine/homoserine lactone efflux protein
LILQTTLSEQVLLTVLQALTVIGYLGVSALAVHLLVGAARRETGAFRPRDARLVLAGATVLFVVAFANLVVTDGIPHESLAGLALGFAGVTYLLYTAWPALFERPDRDATPTPTEETTN